MDQPHGGLPATVSTVKIVVAGETGPGAPSLITSMSELPPLSTHVVTTTVTGPPRSRVVRQPATVVAADLGRTVVRCTGRRYLVYLFGVAGAGWSWAVWDEVCRVAAGLLIVVDPSRPGQARAALDYATSCDLPHLIMISAAAGRSPPAAVRDALALPAYTPLLVCDLTDRHDVRTALTLATGYALSSTPWKGSPCCYRSRAATPASPASQPSLSPSRWP